MLQRLSTSTFLSSASEDHPVYAAEWKPEWSDPSSPAPHPQVLVFVADPVSAAVIAELIIKAVVAKVAELIARKILDLLSGKAIRDIILELFTQIVAALRAELQQQWLEETTAQTTSLKRLLDAYARSPESRANQLPFILVKAEDAFAAAERIGSPAIGVGTMLAALRFSVNAMQATLSQSDGDWLTCESTIDDFEQFTTRVETDVLGRAQGGVSGIESHVVTSRDYGILGIGIGDRPGPGITRTEYFFYHIDGSRTQDFANRGTAESSRAATIQQRTADMMTKVVIPARGVIHTMRESFAAARDG